MHGDFSGRLKRSGGLGANIGWRASLGSRQRTGKPL